MEGRNRKGGGSFFGRKTFWITKASLCKISTSFQVKTPFKPRGYNVSTGSKSKPLQAGLIKKKKITRIAVGGPFKSPRTEPIPSSENKEKSWICMKMVRSLQKLPLLSLGKPKVSALNLIGELMRHRLSLYARPTVLITSRFPFPLSKEGIFFSFFLMSINSAAWD